MVQVDLDSRLMRAATPVIDELGDYLADSRMSVLLADHESLIVARRVGLSAIGVALDQVLAVPGNTYLEEVAGTNALSTAFEVGHPITVRGEEHFLELLRGFACFAHPITHPVTKSLVGVLDVTGVTRESATLMPPLVARAVRDIEERLLTGSTIIHQRMLAALRARAGRTKGAVLVLTDDLTLSNSAADGLVGDAMRHQIRQRVLDAQGSRCLQLLLSHPSGQPVRVVCTPVDGAPGATLCEVAPDDGERRRVPRGAGAETNPVEVLTARLATLARSRTAVLFHGEPGTGRTTAAGLLAGVKSMAVVDAARLTPDDLLCQLNRRVSETLGVSDAHLVVVEDVSLLDDATARRVSRLLSVPGLWFALTSSPLATLTAAQRSLVSLCPERVALRPLRDRRDEIRTIVASEARSAGLVRVTAEALDALIRYDWPGNLTELHRLLSSAFMDESGGPTKRLLVTSSDLPPHVRMCSRRVLGKLEQAERDTIVSSLEDHGGNKLHTASDLGISRTTLYRRLKDLGITS